MKKLMLKFSDALLSTEQMKKVKGGDVYPGWNPSSPGGWTPPPPPPPSPVGGGNGGCEAWIPGGPGGGYWHPIQCPPKGY